MAKELEPKVIVGLEVGTSKVVAVVGEVLPDGVVNVLGVGSCPSKGIDRGSITDLDAVVNSIQRAIEAAESMADCQIMSVTLAITGEHIQSLNESGFVAISENEVTQDEIDDALHTASSVKLPEGLSLLHIIPQEYAVDKQVNIKNPLGLQGVRLKANVHLIACHQDWQNNLKKAVERCGLQVDKVVFSGFAATHSVLTEDEKDLGVLYSNVRLILQIFIFTILIFYFPFSKLLISWIPAYKKSIEYMALLCPILFYESEMALLNNTYMKALRMERIMMNINIKVTIISAVLTFIFCFWLKNLLPTILSVLFLLLYRCYLCKKEIEKKLNLYDTFCLLEFLFPICFVLFHFYLGGILGWSMYIIYLIFFIIHKKKDIKYIYSSIVKLSNY